MYTILCKDKIKARFSLKSTSAKHLYFHDCHTDFLFLSTVCSSSFPFFSTFPLTPSSHGLFSLFSYKELSLLCFNSVQVICYPMATQLGILRLKISHMFLFCGISTDIFHSSHLTMEQAGCSLLPKLLSLDIKWI